MEETYKVLGRADDSGRIVEINSSAFITDTTGWVQIDEGAGDRYHHAQGNYLPHPVMTEQGVYRYKLADGQVVERTAAELAADAAALAAAAAPTDSQRIEALENAVLELMEGNL